MSQNFRVFIKIVVSPTNLSPRKDHRLSWFVAAYFIHSQLTSISRSHSIIHHPVDALSVRTCSYPIFLIFASQKRNSCSHHIKGELVKYLVKYNRVIFFFFKLITLYGLWIMLKYQNDPWHTHKKTVPHRCNKVWYRRARSSPLGDCEGITPWAIKCYDDTDTNLCFL